ncbi:peptidylprolyl isomerase [Treponema zuelzerae]|uniref:Peptidyl-prolyl cis-trans isomerase n=1 Tax=Teretinema zuelzerae TaxID=156 RepID=A0AAE3EID1_9SPIR|nr:peptidylprolyl isomerase [Teretinema zuelzerae]MCD1654336.1 peptidylprolyl isomerase [Teretinema zuelzerae]
MTISKDSVVSIEYTLTDAENEVLDSSEGMGPLEYLHGHNNLIPGLERQLEGKKAGDSLKATVAPADAYGERADDLVVQVERSQFPDDVEITEGMQFEAGGPDGSRIVTVTAIDGDKITVDANHPLAGETLHFDVKVLSVREATDDEKANGLDQGCGCGCGDDCGDDCGEEGCGCGSGGCGCGH